MKELRITVAQTIAVPDDAEIEIAPSGRAIGFRLADGRIVRAQLAFEIEEQGADGEETYHDLTYDELRALDIDVDDLLESEVDEV